MTKGTDPAVLRRKAGAARPNAAPPPDAMTWERAWRLACERSLSHAIGLSCRVRSVNATACPAPEIAGLVEEGDLPLLLEGASGFGAAVLDVQLMAAMIEAQTMGRVLGRPAAPRPVTRTDAALIADPLDRLLGAFEERAAGLGEAATAAGLRYATLASSAEAMALALPDAEHALSEIVMSVGEGERTGRLRILLPVRPPAPEIEKVGPDADWSDTLARSLLASHTVLTAVLARHRMPADRVTRLAPGDLVPLAPQALSQVALTGCTGRVAARGRLGQSGGMKAILLQDLDPLRLGAP
jgi:flagellar motor switch protein FliM